MTKEKKTVKVIKQMMNEGEYYTFSLNPEYQAEKFTTLRRDRMIVDHVINKILINLVGCTYKLYPEFSPLGGRLHYHGYLKITNVYNFYLSLPRAKEKCQIDIDIMNDQKIWKEYIHKDRNKMQPPMEKKRIPYEITEKTVWTFDKDDPDESEDDAPRKATILDFLQK